ncbi:MAG: ABC transporter ATP-binding protein [Sulfurovaceae bacterium]|nr:ABC transporter ATP-binding protein [Sulfurovaceae bacterium]MDD5360332.1 ABC transporter ATP-binding protein [Sulfurovaceae bacterium]MDD5549567.1 ABC transporter ATP-binding protein [Sulfurovaceae bacterium]
MKKLIITYLPYFKDYKREFIIAILGMIAVAAGTAGTAHIIKPVMDDVFIKKDAQMLLIVPFMLVFVFALKGIGRYIQSYYTSYIGQDILRRLREELLLHITKLDMDFFRKNHSGTLLSRITNDISRIQGVVSEIIPELIRDTFTVIALAGYVIYQNPKLAFYFLIVMPLALFPLSKLSKKMRKYSKLSQQSNADMTKRLEEVFSNIEVIKSNSSQDFEIIRFAKDNLSVFKYIMKQVKVNNLTSPIMEILGSIAIGLVIFIGGKEVINGNMSVGGFFSFSAALFMLYDPIKALSKLYNKTQDAVTANERIREIFDIKADIKSGDLVLDKKIENITLKDIILKYDEKVALKNINISFKKGMFYGVVGDSGAGKSSLVNLLVRFYDASNGEVLINSQDIKNFTLNSLHKKIAYVTQNIFIFNDTVAENIAYGENVDRKRVIDALKKAHAFEFVEKLPNGIDTLLAQRGANLSGGQKQRIALARAIYKNPDVLILDEATSALDNISEQKIKDAVFELRNEMIIIAIAHRLSSIQNADEIFYFANGSIKCSGTHENLINNCNGYKKLSKIAQK